MTSSHVSLHQSSVQSVIQTTNILTSLDWGLRLPRMHHLCNSPGHERRALILCRHVVRQVKEQGVHGRGLRHRAFIFCRWRRFHGGFYYILVSKEGCSYPSVHLQPEVIKKCSSLHQFPKSGVWEQSKTIPQISKNRILSRIRKS